MKEWPQIKVGDAAGFWKFYNFLLKCQSIVGGNKWNALDSPDLICMLLSKLPDQPRDRWNREVYSIRANHSRGPELNDLINYVDKETALVSDSLFSKEAVEQYLDKRDSRMMREEGLEAMQSDLKMNQKINQIRTQKRTNVSCVLLVMILMIAVYLCP